MKKLLIVAACSLFAIGAFAQTSTTKPAVKPATTTTMAAKPMGSISEVI
ncbi:MAG: hypothetical protein ABIO24_07555 [Saprospiraceae bacterium]